jgi:peptidyl-prolyl cis-trans isomerase A (cyclophilin A)
MGRFVTTFSFLLAGALLVAQSGTTVAVPKKGVTKAKAAVPAGQLFATISTSLGDIRIRLFEKESPITVKNFVGLANGTAAWIDPKIDLPVKKRLFDGLIFHRVIPGFMIQGGDPLGNGTGGTDDIPDEFASTLKFDKPGILAMANAGPDTGSSQFFITEVATPHLTGKHTIFGETVSGLDVVSKIANVPTGENNRPLEPVVIKKITIQRVFAATKTGGAAVKKKAP